MSIKYMREKRQKEENRPKQQKVDENNRKEINKDDNEQTRSQIILYGVCLL